MQGHFHGVAILVAIAAIVEVTRRTWRAPSGTTRSPVGLVVAGVASFLTFALDGSHLCRAGTPAYQCVIMGILLCVIQSRVEDPRWRRVGFLVTLAAMIGLSHHFIALVHQSGYTGNPHRFTSLAASREERLRRYGELLLETCETDSRSYPAGWLDEVAFVTASSPPLFEREDESRCEVEWAWYTPITGLHVVRSVATMGIWFPGGAPAEGLTRLEWRDRP